MPADPPQNHLDEHAVVDLNKQLFRSEERRVGKECQ